MNDFDALINDLRSAEERQRLAHERAKADAQRQMAKAMNSLVEHSERNDATMRGIKKDVTDMRKAMPLPARAPAGPTRAQRRAALKERFAGLMLKADALARSGELTGVQGAHLDLLLADMAKRLESY